MLRDLQGIRAIAVLLVLIFHLWPENLPGGFVGVDVFFVLSGFFMTNILLNDHKQNGSISFTGFFARRAQRLVPATAVVVISVALLSPLLPATLWRPVAEEIVASAFFMENWLLQYRAVDYLAREIAPGALQHLWSLGVEAQFYVLWPLLIAIIIKQSERLKYSTRTSITLLVLSIGLIFLVASIVISYSNSARAYFSTSARVWEFCVGGVIAAGGLRETFRPTFARLAGYTGLLAILISAFAIDNQMVFPGWVAIFPCLGTGLLIVSGNSVRAGFIHRALTWRPLTYLGDISYSVYLWHWPLIFFSGYLISPNLSNSYKFAIGATSIGLAVVSKILIEDPFRIRIQYSWKQKAVISSFAFALLAVAGGLIPLLMKDNYVNSRVFQTSNPSANYHPGALALTDAAAVDDDAPAFIPDVVQARSDGSLADKERCQAALNETEAQSCNLGYKEGFFHIVLVGDSHAAQLSDGFQQVANELGWEYTHMSKTECPFTESSVKNSRAGGEYDTCNQWNKNVLNKINSLSPDLVVTTHSSRYTVTGTKNKQESFDRFVKGSIAQWNKLLNNGIGVVAIKDIPYFKSIAADCVAAGTSDCAKPRSEVIIANQAIVEAANQAEIPIMDLTKAICGPEVCEPIVGNVFVWRDSNHLTATYIRTMSTEIKRQLINIVNEIR